MESPNRVKPDGKKIIAMSLYGDDPRYVWGAIRNMQLAPVFFPAWTVRIYVEKPRPDGSQKFPKVPARIINKLKSLGAQIAYVDFEKTKVPPMMWRFLVADDLAVSYFIVRDSDSRLSDRDATVVGEWLKSGSLFHCIRDHPSHANYAVSGGMWGAKPKELLKIFGKSFELLMKGFQGDYLQDMSFLGNIVWPKVKDNAICHDSVSCKKFAGSRPFPVERNGQEHIGQVYDMFGDGRQGDMDIIKNTPKVAECTDITSLLPGVIPGEPTDPPPLMLGKINKKITIWSADLRIGPVRELKYILEPAGVKFIDKSLSPNCNLSHTCASGLKILNSSSVVNVTTNLTHQFFLQYKMDPEMQNVTHFLCIHPTATCEFYMKFGKPMIILATDRYEYGRTGILAWENWNKNLKEIEKLEKNIVAATNTYDKAYMKHYTGIEPKLLESFCGYVNTVYAPSKSEFLLSSTGLSKFEAEFFKNFEISRKAMAAPIALHLQSEKLPHYAYKNLAAYMGIVYIPTDVSSIYFCEIYQMNIPIFIPTIELLVDIWQKDWKILYSRTLNKLREALGVNATVTGVEKDSDPNQEIDPEITKKWVNLADLYQLPHTVQFSTIADLVRKLKNANLREMSRNMKATNKERRKDILEKWRAVLKQTSGAEVKS